MRAKSEIAKFAIITKEKDSRIRGFEDSRIRLKGADHGFPDSQAQKVKGQ